MYQLISSLRKAQEEAGEKEISFPYSFFIKGNLDIAAKKLSLPLVVKSCSSYRSKVAALEEFQKWDKENIKNIPTLFQQHLKGEDIRVHICDNTLWALKIKGKDYVDYRYSTRGSVKYEEIELRPGTKKFCKFLSRIENNSLLGIDFISLGKRYFCLESNPGPGWSTFNHPSRKEFAAAVFSKLTSNKESLKN